MSEHKRKVSPEQAAEIQDLEQRGIVHAKDVLAFAENSDTALHDWFDWDDSVAAYQYRLNQAREVIRLTITFAPKKEPQTTYVNLITDRPTGGGYRRVKTVLASNALMEDLQLTALVALKGWMTKYAACDRLDYWMDTDTLDEQIRELREPTE